MQWLIIKCLEWNLYSGPRTDWHARTGLYWMILREGEGDGVLTDVDGGSGGYLDSLRFRHSWSDTEAWPVRCYKRYIPRCRPYHPLPVKYEDDRVSERNQWKKSEILVRERNQGRIYLYTSLKKPKGSQKCEQKKNSKNELFTHLKWLPIFWYFHLFGW